MAVDAKVVVPCIVSAQGFHLEICDNHDFLFKDRKELREVLSKIKDLFFIITLLKT